jgi:hypothetical protein
MRDDQGGQEEDSGTASEAPVPLVVSLEPHPAARQEARGDEVRQRPLTIGALAVPVGHAGTDEHRLLFTATVWATDGLSIQDRGVLADVPVVR